MDLTHDHRSRRRNPTRSSGLFATPKPCYSRHGMIEDPDFPPLQRIEKPVRTLSPRDPRDHLLLLWWLFITPYHLRDYFLRVGDESIKQVGSWLISTLFWFPLLVVAMGIAFGSIPVLFPLIPGWLAGPMLFSLVAIGWVATAWLGQMGILKLRSEVELSAEMAENVMPRVMRRVAFDIAGIALLFSLCGVTYDAVIAGLVLVVALIVTFGITSGVANRVAGFRIERAVTLINYTVAMVTAVGIMVAAMGSVSEYPVVGSVPRLIALAAGPVAGIVTFIAVAMSMAAVGVVTDVIVERTFESDDVQYTLRITLLVALGIAHLAVIVICLFGGWQMLSRIQR